MKPHIQTTPFTGAASAILTILNHDNPKIQLTKENEFKIWNKSVLLPTRASCIFALATFAQQQGLSPEVIVENTTYNFPDYRFYRYTKQDVDDASFMSKIYLQKAQKNNVPITTKEITLELIKAKLQQNKTILLRINTKPIRNKKRNTSNYVVVQKYQNKMFQIIDPQQGGLSVPEETFVEAFET